MNRSAAASVFLTALVLSGCIAPSPPLRSAAPNYSAPVDVSFQKLIQPAFAQDYAGKTVQFDATYYGSRPTLIDLPPEYQTGFVRIMLGGGAGSTMNVLVPKEYAEATFDLKTGTKVRVTAYAQLLAARSIAGGTEARLLLIANSMLPAAN